MEKKKRIPVGTWIISALSILAVAGSLLYASSNTAKATRSINLANRYLAALDYENASIAYSEALEFDPENLEALRGLMKSTYAEGDYKTLSRTLKTFAGLVDKDNLSVSDELLILSMTQNSAEAFDDPADYQKFVEDIIKKTDSEDLQEIVSEGNISTATDLLLQGKYQEAYELIKDLLDDPDSALSDEFKKDFLVKVSELAWSNSDYETAFECLKKASELFPDDPAIKEYLALVTEDYIQYLIDNQEYDKAKDTIDWIKEATGDDSYSDMIVEIDDMEYVDEKLQNIIEMLNKAFDNDDIDSIQTIMGSEEFYSYTSEIKDILFSDSLKGTKRKDGHGTAIYMVDGKPYVYYGDYKNGKREGTGLWYTSSDVEGLLKYSLTWENDLPNGEGQLDQYVTFTMYGPGGEEQGKETKQTTSTFTTRNGVCVGTYTTYIDGYTVNWNLENGYAPQIMPENYPDYIKDFMTYPQILSAYIYNVFGTSYWWTWEPNRWTVNGLGVLTDDLGYTEEGIDIIL